MATIRLEIIDSARFLIPDVERPEFLHFKFSVKSGRKSEITGLSSQMKPRMVAVMVWGKTSSGTKKCRKFTFLVSSVSTTPVISTALLGQYYILDHNRNGYSDFINRFPLIQ
jgi:hypothetical protein